MLWIEIHLHDYTAAACQNMPTPPVPVSDCLTWNCHLSGGNLHCMRSVAQHDCPWQSGAERVFGLGRIIHSPLKRIGESHRLWWVVSWCLFHITRTGLFVSQPGRFGTTTASQKASWVIATALERFRSKVVVGRGGEGRSGWDVLVSSLLILPQILGFREMMW